MTWVLALWAGVLSLNPGPVTGLSIAPAAERTEVVISVEGDVTYRSFTMEGPSRLVVDVFGARQELPDEDFLELHRGGVRSIRASQFSQEFVRVVLELEELVAHEVLPVTGGVRVSLENRHGAFQPWSTGVLRSAASAEVASTGAPPAVQAAAPPTPAPTAGPVRQEAPRITVSFVNTPIQDVLLTFAEFSGRSIVAGARVTGAVTANVVNQPWDEALRAILRTNGFYGEETQEGIIEVHLAADFAAREAGEVLLTSAYRIDYAPASEIGAAVQTILSERGTVAVAAGTNTLVVTDIPRVHQSVLELIGRLDVETPQVAIHAKIIFVSRTDLNEFGVTYDLKDSAGNQLNVITPGAVDADGDGVITLPEEQVDVGTNVIALGGNSVAALGNATNRVVGPTLTLLTSLLVGRHTLITFIEALESSNLSDIQAAPSLRVMDNQTARIVVGEDTPIRVIDASAGGQPGGLPVASVEIQETGIILEATPHVTAGDMILLDLLAERSAPQLAQADAGVIFTKQNTTTRVLVRDGQTVVIGGLTVTENNEVRAGIPLLMDLPLIGRLFRVTRRSAAQRDLIILVTPHIVRESN